MEAMPAPIESLPEAEPEAGPAPVDLANASAAPDDLGGKDLAHAARFEKYTGMSPQRCFRYVLLSLGLRQMATCWYGMIALEYMRYYITNDLGRADVLKTATTSPLFAVQAFLFPFWGVVADRVSRKRVLVAACFASVVSSWMITFIPSITTFVLANVTNLVGDLAGPIRERHTFLQFTSLMGDVSHFPSSMAPAMKGHMDTLMASPNTWVGKGDAILRDLCTVEEWETSHGGATGIKARMFVIGHAAFLVAAAIGMVLLKLGENGIGLPNEYQVHKAECSEMFCLHPGQYSWNSFWEVDGSLRLLMMMGAIATTLDFCVATLLLPETLRPEHRCGTILKFVQSNWREFVRPWNNLRVIATPQLQYLMFVRFLVYVVFAGWNSICLCFYQRFAFDTFTMTLHTLAAGLTTWLVTMAVPLLVVRFGDLRGVWIPQIVLMTVFVISAALLPPGHGYMAFVLYLLLAGPALGFGSMAPELLPKLVPSNIQGTYQTARYFIFRLSQAVFAWPWNQLFLHTRRLQYPVDGILLWLAILIFLIVLWLTIRILPQDPRAAILQGRALEAFWDTPYVRGEWYRYHSGAIVGKARQAEV